MVLAPYGEPDEAAADELRAELDAAPKRCVM